MSNFRARHSNDPLDLEVQGQVRSARRAVVRAVDLIKKAKRPRYQTRKAYSQLMTMGEELGRVKSTLPEYLQDPELLPDPDDLPEWLRERSAQIEMLIRRANESYAMASRCLEVAEEAFNQVELTFAQDEVAHMRLVQQQLTGIEAGLRSYRGIGGRARGVPDPEIVLPDPVVEEAAPPTPDPVD